MAHAGPAFRRCFVLFFVLPVACALAADPPPADQSAAIKAQADAEAAIANAAKAAADARKAQAEADLAAAKARLEVTGTPPTTGATTVNAEAGSMEANILAARAAHEAARQIAEQVKAAGAKEVMIFAAGDVPRFDALIAFRLNANVFRAAYDLAETDVKAEESRLNKEYPTPARAATVAEAGLLVDALSKIVSYFKTDYTFGGVAVTADDQLLTAAVAGQLNALNIPSRLPAVFNDRAINNAAAGVVSAIKDSAELRNRAVQRAAKMESVAKAAKDQMDKPGADKPKLQKDIDSATNVAARWKSVAAMYDTLFNKMLTPDDKGTVPGGVLAKEAAIADYLAATGRMLLAVRVSKAGGTHFTEKNLWTAFGKMPFFVGGGVVVSFVLLKGEDGTVAAAGDVPVNAGFHRLDKVK